MVTGQNARWKSQNCSSAQLPTMDVPVIIKDQFGNIRSAQHSQIMRRLRNLKIVATLGPASDEYAVIRKMFEVGTDVFRLNMSHGTQDDVRRRYEIIRKIEVDLGQPIGILADLQGPKLRCGEFANESEELADGASFRFDLSPEVGDCQRVCLPHKEIFDALEIGHHLLVDDGKIRLRVQTVGDGFADCTVLNGGLISARKGVNVPDAVIPLAALSDKDRRDMEFACELGVDWLAMSFVQCKEDVAEGKALAGGRAAIMAKIEKPAAVKRFDEILDASDGIMIARGDLGVELPVQDVPPIQKRLIRKCRAAAKPVIVATQMLESMIQSPTPTRAEVSDVATAIYEGADAVMLSAESAAGDFPVEAVTTMHNVAISVENDSTYRQVIEASRKGERNTVADAITSAAREIAETTDVKSICCFTHSGTTAYLMARERSRVSTIALTPFDKIARRLCLTWGAHCVVTGLVDNFDDAVNRASSVAREENFGSGDDHIVIMAGVPFNISGTTNIVQVKRVGDD